MADVGLYSLAYKFGMLVGYIQVPFESYWEAQVFHVVRDPGGQRHFVRALTYYSAALFGGALFVSLAAMPVLRLLTRPEYYQAAVLVPVVAFAYAVRGPGDYFRSVFAICKQPFRNVIVTTAGVIVTLLSYSILIPRYRGAGAAVATAITFVAMGAVSYWQSRKARVFHFEWRRLLRIVLCSVSIATAALWYRPQTLAGRSSFRCWEPSRSRPHCTSPGFLSRRSLLPSVTIYGSCCSRPGCGWGDRQGKQVDSPSHESASRRGKAGQSFDFGANGRGS